MVSLPKPRILIGALALILGTSTNAAHYKAFLLGGVQHVRHNNTKVSSLTPAQQNYP